MIDNSLFFRVLRHLLPRAKAWSVTVDKLLRDFLEGIANPIDILKSFWFDLIWLDVFPDTTRQLAEWQAQWALLNVPVDEEEQRQQLDATWKALGGQDPYYLQTTLQNAGFDVYIHEWWIPGTEPPLGVDAVPSVRNPLLYLNDESGFLQYLTVCGNATAICGYVGAVTGASANPKGYPLVNKILQAGPDILDCGDKFAVCGNTNAVCGATVGFKIRFRRYTIPTDPSVWPYFLYFGGETFPDLANIPQSRKDEFETLVLKICPTEQWLGILVNYT